MQLKFGKASVLVLVVEILLPCASSTSSQDSQFQLTSGEFAISLLQMQASKLPSKWGDHAKPEPSDKLTTGVGVEPKPGMNRRVDTLHLSWPLTSSFVQIRSNTAQALDYIAQLSNTSSATSAGLVLVVVAQLFLCCLVIVCFLFVPESGAPPNNVRHSQGSPFQALGSPQARAMSPMQASLARETSFSGSTTSSHGGVPLRTPPMSQDNVPLCLSLCSSGPRTFGMDGALSSQPQDVVINIRDDPGCVVARACAHENGCAEPGVVMDAEGFGYFAFLDTERCQPTLSQVQTSERCVLVRRASTGSMGAEVYAVLTISSTATGSTVMARRGVGVASGSPLLAVRLDSLGRIVEVVNGNGKSIAQVETLPRTPEAWCGNSFDGMESSGLKLKVAAAADGGLVLCAVLGAQKLR
jgi:hypothetical protein